jgi:excisionase family DNA binding protein
MNLTLQEIATHFKRTPKAFAKLVRDQNIPHYKLGRSMLFDLNEVRAYLRARPTTPVTVKYKPVRKRRDNKLAEALGLYGNV